MKKFILLLLLFVSCTKMKFGTVVEKEYHAEYTVTIWQTQTIGKTSVMIPLFVTYPEQYGLKIDGMTTKGKHAIKDVYVSKRQSDTINVGDFICIEGMCDEPIKIEK